MKNLIRSAFVVVFCVSPAIERARAENPPAPSSAAVPQAAAPSPPPQVPLAAPPGQLQPPAPPPKDTPPPLQTQTPPPPQAQPIEPPRAVGLSPGPPAPVAPTPAGQWVYTAQYGWLWMPYAPAYTHVVADAALAYAFVYYPAFGWRWVVAPWVLGFGVAPYWGALGPVHFGWYARPWFRVGVPYHPYRGPGWGHRPPPGVRLSPSRPHRP